MQTAPPDHLKGRLDLAECHVENLGYQVDLGARDDVRRAQVDMVTAAAVVRAWHPGQEEDVPGPRTTDHAAGQAGLFWERLPGGAVGHELHPREQPQAPHVP